MEVLKINILNPKAAQLLRDLADLDLISIEDDPKTAFYATLDRLRSGDVPPPTLDEIAREVEAVRSVRYSV
ncbi:hypothetical protein [Dyadobacter sandarakinus]|uniref:Addiction module component n=1 Tax=Dyadobacter sandarakinus TaxID=2747268 RepID=A0ABX7I8S6_9BACT|nr:hypothetical protein [Dyadobacter sandarakinus]QRR02185.1 hypothetical protein HWI92_15355 [Dyadobacter sandarakinus]